MSFFIGCRSSSEASLKDDYKNSQLLYLQGYIQEPLKISESGYRRSSRYPDLNWRFRVLRAEILNRQGKSSDALELLAPVPDSAVSTGTLFRRSLARGTAFCNSHNYQQAELEFSAAEQEASSDPRAGTELMLLRGRCHQIRGKFADAFTEYAKVRDSRDLDEFGRLYALMGLGLASLRQNQYEDAARWYLLAQDPAYALKAVPYEEIVRGNLGFIYSELGDFDKALGNSRAAAELATHLNLTSHMENWLLDIGREYQGTGRFGLARENYKKSLAIAQAKHNDVIAGRCLHNLVVMELRSGHVDLARDYLQQALRLHLQSDDDRRDLRIDRAFIAAETPGSGTVEQDFLQLISEVHNIPLKKWELEARLARLYADQGKPNLADHWFRQAIATVEAAADHLKAVELKIAMLDNWPIFDDYIAFLYQQKQPERALQVAQFARARTLAEELGLKPKQEDAHLWLHQIQAMLGIQHSVILAYYEAERNTYVWNVTANKLEMKALGVNQNDLETLADTYREEINQHTSIDSSPAQTKLYQILIAPMAALIPHNAHVILVGDSALYRINFEALISDEGRPHYWIDDAEIENASSIDLLLAEKRVSRHGTGALIIGAPKQVSPQYPLLPHAQEEVESVEHQFRPGIAKAFEGAAATPDAYLKSQPSRFKYIEFASHSTASSSDPMASSIVLSNGSNGFQLFARDIVQVHPQLNADLVSISGCYSVGKFRTSAEGLLGLQWAFMRAGAHQVVAGLWDVDDKSSPQLMGGLYSGIVHGESASAALRAAKRKMIHATQSPPPPYYWAALQLYTGL